MALVLYYLKIVNAYEFNFFLGTVNVNDCTYLFIIYLLFGEKVV